MLSRPLACRGMRVRYVVRRGQPPGFAIWKEEAEVLRVVIPNGRSHIERLATEDFGSRLRAKPELINQQEQLRVVVDADLSKVQMAHRAKGLRLNLAPVRSAVEAPSHEVRTTAYLPQLAVCHLDTRARGTFCLARSNSMGDTATLGASDSRQSVLSRWRHLLVSEIDGTRLGPFTYGIDDRRSRFAVDYQRTRTRSDRCSPVEDRRWTAPLADSDRTTVGRGAHPRPLRRPAPRAARRRPRRERGRDDRPPIPDSLCQVESAVSALGSLP